MKPSAARRSVRGWRNVSFVSTKIRERRLHQETPASPALTSNASNRWAHQEERGTEPAQNEIEKSNNKKRPRQLTRQTRRNASKQGQE